MAWFTAADSQRIDDLRRSEWPAHAIECRTCDGTGGDFWQDERCNGCMGRGFNLPDCRTCCDTGEMPVMDPEGQHDGMEPCIHCDAGDRVRAGIAAEYAAMNAREFDARYQADIFDRMAEVRHADLDAHMHDRIAAGLSPY